MEKIELLNIKKEGCVVHYDFQCSENLKKYFTGLEFVIEYPETIDQVPDGVLAIPFATNTLQIMWLANCELVIPELDKDFYESIPKFLEGYQNMYPEATFAGKLTVGSIVECVTEKSDESAVFFSGGLDATTTLLRHLDEKPHLLSIWGADVGFENEEGWNIVENGLKDAAEQYNLQLAVIHSRFREFDDAEKLTEDFRDILQTTWWYGVKHGIGLIGHAAPYAWLHGIKMVYIGSSHCVEDGKVCCASDPTIDSNVAFCGTKVFHDAYELHRQNKTKYVAQFYGEHPDTKINLRVCWKSQTGENCCNCEKCYRTMVGLWVAGVDPRDFGFNYDNRIFHHIYQFIALRDETHEPSFWTHMKNDLRENWDALADKPYRKHLEWMLDFDFFNLEENECRKKYRATWDFKSKIVKLCPHLYKLYIKLRGYSYE